MVAIPVICYGCHATASVAANRVTASLKCGRCGSDDLDVYDGEIKTAASPGTGWGKPRPDVLEDWDEYQGPAVGKNPLADTETVHDKGVYDPNSYRRGNPSYNPAGGYEVNQWPSDVGQAPDADEETHDANTNGPEVGGARWDGKRRAAVTPLYITLPDGMKIEVEGRVTAYRTSGDPMGSVEQYNGGNYVDPTSPAYRPPHKPVHPSNGIIRLPNPCPECGHGSTMVTRDHKDEGWWSCPNCGPLANTDRHPEIDPRNPPKDFVADRSMKTKVAKNANVQKTGQLLKMIAKVMETNSGVTDEEAFHLSRRALERYGHN